MKNVGPSATPGLSWVWPHRAWRWGAGLSGHVTCRPLRRKTRGARVLCGPGHSELQLRASWQIFSQLRSDRQAEESWYQGEVFSVIQSHVNPITTSTIPQLTISVKKQKLHTTFSLLVGQWFIVSNLVSNSICMELISFILASGILYWELINSNSYLGHTHYTHITHNIRMLCAHQNKLKADDSILRNVLP